MKVSDLSFLLDHLAEGLKPVVNATITNDLSALRSAMAPFSDRTVADFVKFLAQCEEFQRTGVLSGKKTSGKVTESSANPQRITDAVNSVRSFYVDIERGQASPQRMEQLLAPLNALSKPELDEVAASLDLVGKARSKKEVLQKIRQMMSNVAEAGTRNLRMSSDT